MEVMLEYKGHLTFSTIGRLLTMLKHVMVRHQIKTGIYKRIITVMIEALENVYKNSDTYHHNEFIRKNYLPSFRLLKNKHSYKIIVANPVKLEDVPGLKEKIDSINGRSVEELKLLYRQTITDGQFSDKGGAGLGLLEMAKISGKPLNYSFKPINDQFAEYSLTIDFE